MEHIANVVVPVGRSRVVRAPPLPQTSEPCRLVLEGDDQAFDNVVHYCVPPIEELTVAYVGSDSSSDPEQSLYYLTRAFPETKRRKVRVEVVDPEEPVLSWPAGAVSLIVVDFPVHEPHVNRLRQFAEAGGTLLYLARDNSALASLEELLEVNGLRGAEADVDGYVMLTDLDFTHPVLASFSDVRFADFTKLHVWKHRSIDINVLPQPRVLGRFDDGDPALVEMSIGSGKVLLFLTGWHPEDSQLALSSKFVPILQGILNYAAGHAELPVQYTVGDTIVLPQRPQPSAADATVRLPGGSLFTLAPGESTVRRTGLPGIYTVDLSGDRLEFAVNLAPSESKTAVLPRDRLEALGVPLRAADHVPHADRSTFGERQMSRAELEQGQALWRWLILAAVGVLLLETWLAGRTAAASAQREVEAP